MTELTYNPPRTKWFHRLVYCVLILCTYLGDSSATEEEGDSDILLDLNDPSDEVHSRQKRFVYVNAQSPVDIGFLIVVPYSFALPTFNLQTSRRYKRSVELEQELLADLTENDIFPTDSYDEPAYSIEARKIASYFSALKIEEDICQRRIICEIFSSPDDFHPFSGMLVKNLVADHGPLVETNSSRYYRYVRAMQEGMSNGLSQCKEEYGRCPYSFQDRFNMPALLFWNWLTNLLSMEFRD